MLDLRRPWAEIVESITRASISDAADQIASARFLLAARTSPSPWWVEPLGKNIPVGLLLLGRHWADATDADRARAIEAFIAWASTSPLEVISIVAASLPSGGVRKAVAEAVIAAVPEEVDYLDKPRVERLTHLFRALLPDSADVGVRNLDSPSAPRRAVAVVVAPALEQVDAIDRLGRLAISGEDGEAPRLATEHLGEVRHPRAMFWLKRVVASTKETLPHGTEVALVRVQTTEALLLLLKAVNGEKYSAWPLAIEESTGTAPRGPLAAPVLAALRRLLKAPAAGKREFATGIAVHWRLPEAIDLLRAALAGKGGNDLRELSARWARAWVDPRTTEMLLAALKSKSEYVRDLAIVAMAERRVKEAIEPLRALSKKAKHSEKATIRAALAVIEPSDGALAKAFSLIPVGLSAIDRHTMAVEAAWSGGARRARQRLIHELSSSDLGARAAAALASLRDPGVAPLIARGIGAQEQRRRPGFLLALWRLSELPDAAPGDFSSIQAICRQGSLSACVPAALDEVSRRFPNEQTAALLRFAESEGHDLNEIAAELAGVYLVAALLCLDRIGAHESAFALGKSAVAVLMSMPPETAVELITQGSPELQAHVIEALREKARAKIGEHHVAQARELLDRLRPVSPHDLSHRAVSGPSEASLKAIHALRDMGTPAATAGLRAAALKNRNGYVRAEALAALAQANLPATAPLLKRALKAKSQAERTYAAIALASMGSAEGQKALKKLLSADWLRSDIPALDPEETRPPHGLTKPLKTFLESLTSGNGELPSNADFCLEVWGEAPRHMNTAAEPTPSRDVAELVLAGPAGIRRLWEIAERGGLA